MLVKTATEILKSVAIKSLTASSEPSRRPYLSIIFLGCIGGISVIFAEAFFGVAFYKLLTIDYNYSDGISLLFVGGIYSCQLGLCIILIQRQFKKMVHENYFLKEFKMLKRVLTSLINGFNSR